MSNRILKFRAWDKLAKQFTYPDKGYQGHYVLTLNGQFQNLQNGSGGDEYVVQQWTGIQDSKGNEVWEGDIVSYVLHGIVYAKEVTFSSCGWILGKESNHRLYIGLPKSEVIGNIFEHPELLKNEK
jgi:hypothetical protein